VRVSRRRGPNRLSSPQSPIPPRQSLLIPVICYSQFVYYTTITIVLATVGIETTLLTTLVITFVVAFFGALAVGIGIAVGLGGQDCVAENINDWMPSVDILPEDGESPATTNVTIETVHTPIVPQSCDRVCIDFRWLL